MGFLTAGPYYDLIGRTGNNVGRRVRGRNVFSIRPAKSNRPPSELQLDQNLKFGLMMSWQSGIQPLIDVGFREHEESESAMNAALSYNLKNSITGVSPNFTIDYTVVLYSRGQLSGPYNPELAVSVASELEFNWLATLANNQGAPTDMATFMVYNPAKKLFVVLEGAVARSELTYTLLVPADFSGDTVHCFMSFVATNGKKVSNSVYIGETEVM